MSKDILKSRARQLERAGWRKISGGFFSNVYKHADYPDRVRKIAKIDGTFDYYQTCKRKAAANPYFPRVLAIAKHAGWYEADLEVLTETSKSPSDRELQREREMCGQYIIWRARHPADPVPSAHKALSKRARAACNALAWNHMRDGAARQWSLDLHGANVMAREVGDKWQLVITDPLSFPRNGAAEKLAES